MALIQCGECNRDVSTEAAACPKCGAKPRVANQPNKKRFIGPILFFLLSISPAGSAQAFDKNQFCIQFSSVYGTAALLRDYKQSPQEAYKKIMMHPHDLVKDQAIKEAINKVYFDQKYLSVDHDLIYDTVLKTCLMPPPQYEPLK
jgi:hypothetical protein